MRKLAALAMASLGIGSALNGQTVQSTSPQLATTSGPVIVIKTPLTLARCTVKGDISFAGSHMGVNFDTAKGDKCSNITVYASEQIPAPTPVGGGIGGLTWKDIAPPIKATGDILTKKCSYIFPNSVPTGKQVHIRGVYQGGLGAAATQAGGSVPAFTGQAGQTYVKNFTITFVLLT